MMLVMMTMIVNYKRANALVPPTPLLGGSPAAPQFDMLGSNECSA